MAQEPLNLLCVEPRFPGRLGAVADWLVRRRGYRCWFYCHTAEPPERWPESVGRGLEVVPFNVGGVARERSVAWRRHLERGLCYAYGCWEVLDERRPRPVDVVLGRSAGLGSTLFVPVVAPRVPIVNLFDYYLHPHRHDIADEAGPETPVEYFHWRRSANAMELLDLENGVTPWTPTAWQRDLFPREYRDDFVVLFDGIDTRRFKPPAWRAASGGGRPARREIAGRVIPPETRVVTFVARHLDRVRGFDRFMSLANRLLRARGDVICVVVGDPIVERGLDVQFYGQDFKAHVLAAEPPHDAERLWFLGSVAQAVVAEVLAASDLHVVPSRSFPVARSCLEAMAAGCVVLAWDTEPVRQVLTHGQTGLIVPPGDSDAIERQALAVLGDPAAHAPIGQAAAARVAAEFAQDVTLPQLATLLSSLVQGD